MGMPPAVAREVVVPTKERRWRHDQAASPVGRDEPGTRREQRSVRPSQQQPRSATAEHGDVVPERQEFGLAGEVVAATDEQPERRAER